jgi:hypothetical protein
VIKYIFFDYGRMLKIMRNKYLRSIILILSITLLFISYENLVINFIQNDSNPILLTRTFQTVLFISIFWIFYKKNSSYIYKFINLFVTILVFNFAAYLASPMLNLFKTYLSLVNNIPELVNFFGNDFMNMVNNKYFGYSSSFLACLAVVRLVLDNFLNKVFIQIFLNPSEYIYTCKCCNSIINKVKS